MSGPSMVKKNESMCLSFDGVFKKWAVKYIRQNSWRLNKLYDFDDLLQEACLKFLQCRVSYPEVSDPKHFMSLYKRALQNHFHDLASSTRTASGIEVPERKDWNHGWLNVLISEAPPELKLLISKLGDEHFCEKISNARNGRKRGCLRKRESMNEILCRLLELDPKQVDLLSMAHNHFIQE